MNDLHPSERTFRTRPNAGPRRVAVLGATGMVGRRLARLLLGHPRFVLDRVVGSDASVGAPYRAVWEKKEQALRRHYGDFWQACPVPPDLPDLRVSSFGELLASDCPVVFSSIPDRAGELEERLVEDGRVVFSNSPHRRFDPAVPLVVSEVNGDAIGPRGLIKNPNCVTSGLVLILAALEAAYGLRAVVVTTYQSLSGRGDAKYAPELVRGNIYPLHASAEGTEGYIRREVKKILGGAFPVSVTCNRAYVQEGHFVEVRLQTRTPVADAAQAAAVLSTFNPLQPLGLPTSPRAPIVVLSEQGRPRPVQDAGHCGGMAIAVGNLTTDDEVFDLRLTYVVNNLVRGAAGGALLNAELWDARHAPPVATRLDGAAAAGASLAALFEARVERHPDRVAATCGERSITFGELDRRAEQVALRLRRSGVAADVAVGVCLPRSLEMLVALLGVVKAGAAYLPLDPGYPRERLAYMLDDSRVRVVLHDGAAAAPWDSGRLPAGVELIGLAGLGGNAAAHGTRRAEAEAVPDALAYVIYTSGSTGRPKGVLGTQRGMLNRLAWMWETFPFQPGEVGCVKTSLSFLDSFCEIFGPLLQGVPVVVVPDDVVKDSEALVRALEAGRVTRLVVVPSLLRALLTTVPDIGARLRALTLWVTSGEALPLELARRFADTFPAARLLNLYGASEVSADCTWHDVTEQRPPAGVAIGRPLPNNEVHLFDDELQAVPEGTEGQLYVAGVSLARGYFGRPDLTAERFLPNPLGPPGSRVYRTGDRARRRAGGVLEFLGRSDQQVKVRGFRVELGEIEAALKRHPAVTQAVVVAREERPGHKQLVGYVVAAPGADGAALRAHVAGQLPDYMVPAAVTLLPTLPLTPSGKLDRNALPAPDFAAPGRQSPRTPRETLLAGLFAEVLELEQVGIDDRFVDLGGDSISSMELVSRARAAGLTITSGDVFRHQTVAALAAAARAPASGQAASAATAGE